MSSLPLTTDGDFSVRALVQPTEIIYPFLNWPAKDTATKLFERFYEIDRASYAPFAALATLPADSTADPADSLAYILEEDKPVYSPDGIARYRCLFGHIPPQKTIQTSVKLLRPDIEGTYTATGGVAYGAFRIFKPDLSLLRYDAYTAQTITSDAGAPGFYPTGGTYTLTFAGYTTGALNYNDAAGTVQTALNALTSVSNRGSVTVTGTYNSAGGFVITFADYATLTLTSSLTGGTVVTSTSKTNNGYTQLFSASLSPVKLTISTDLTLLTKSGGTWFNSTDYSDGGSPLLSDMSRINILASGGYYYVTGGTYTLTIGAYTTAAIPYNADIVDIQAAVDAVAPGLFRLAPWPEAGFGPGGYYDVGAWSGIWFAVYFLGGAVTGGTYTLTVGANTTGAIAYNASAATVSTALNALTSVTNRGGCTVSGTLAGGFAIAFTNAAITATSTSLTPSGALATPSITDSAIGRTQKVIFSNNTVTRDLYLPAHGIATGETLYLKLAASATYYYGITNYSVPDANTIRLNLTPSDAYAAVGTLSECGKRTKRAYTPGSRSIAADKVTDYYLPGAPGQPATDDDITIPVSQEDGPYYLEAVFTGQGTINYEVGLLEPWRGPILALTRTVIAVSEI